MASYGPSTRKARAMKLSDDFNKDYNATMNSKGALGLRMSTGGGTNYMVYDFNLRFLTVRTGSSEGGAVVIPFADLDPDSLEALRDKLIELGGNPPELNKTDKPAFRSATGFKP